LATKDVPIVEYFFQMVKQDAHVAKQHSGQKLEEKERRIVLVFIRTKKVKGENYLYLVRSVWDAKKSTSRQEIIKYLGNAATATSKDIPIDFQNDPKITAFLSSNLGKTVKQKEELTNKLKKKVFECLTNGQRDEVIKIYQVFTKSSSVDEFIEKILRPVMYQVGDLWAANKLSVASEHIASNIAHDLVKFIGGQISKENGRGKILICTPPGEEHNLGCNIIESFLKSKRYNIFNLSPSAPTESIINFIEDNKPDMVLVSITLEDNIKPGQRFVKQISEKFDLPVIIGGLALENNKNKFNGIVTQENSLSKIYNEVRTQLS
jgi:MerR family transcriptional regulator, light-induced transcriptional regulator